LSAPSSQTSKHVGLQVIRRARVSYDEIGRCLRRQTLPLGPVFLDRQKSRRAGPEWVREIQHDGSRILARKDGDRVNLITRNGYDSRDRFPPAGAAIAALPGAVVRGRRARPERASAEG
jgi:ATP-dependent DNA ligase